LVGRNVFNWEGDAGLPNVTALFVVVGVVAGVVVTLLTRPEPKHALSAFYLLMKTPIGREDILLKAGFTESAGKGTLEPPTDPVRLEEVLAEVERTRFPKVRRQAVAGTLIVSFLVLVVFFAVRLLASWLAGP